MAVSATINGKIIAADEGRTILRAALDADLYIPHLCSHPDLTPQGGCKLCTVELRRAGVSEPELATACNTLLGEGMRIVTRTPAIDELRTMSVELLLADHPKDCTGCRMYLKCEFQAMIQYLSATGVRMRDVRSTTLDINTNNPLIEREMERCIRCGRCIRVCKDVRGVDALRYNRKGYETYVGTEGDLPLADTNCRFCGACVEVCPTGALQDRAGVFRDDLPRVQALIPCKAECPVHTDIPRYLRYAEEGRYSDADAVIREKIPMPLVLGHICTAYCEKKCKRNGLNGAVSIRAVKRFVAEHDEARTWKERRVIKSATGRRVAVIGAGPCGLTAAYYLRKQGHDVQLIEKQTRPGGMLAYGIPRYRLPREVLSEEIDDMLKVGVELETGREVTDVASLKNKGYDAVLVAVGAWRGKRLPLRGAELPGAVTALEFLEAAASGQDIRDIGLNTNETPIDWRFSKVCVLGGGNVAFDAARTAVRLGADVTLMCLEARGAMLADEEEIEQGGEEGVRILPGKTFLEIEESGGRVSGVLAQDISGFSFADGELVVDAIPDSIAHYPADLVIFAAGQTGALTAAFGLELNRSGYPVCDGFHTSVEGVFAAGDAVTGTKAVIDAVAQGREAASAIDISLGGDGVIDEDLVTKELFPPDIGVIEGFAALPRQTAIALNAQTRKAGFTEVDSGLACAQAPDECERCLQCDLRTSIERIAFSNAYSI
jgi:NADPH-dependent glutamate synthase beta subunit-like oxidoreductase/formate hydrogenlyase subunit 6/NADH:ubiquinone oxidoreductase subunit I/ferredoxin